MVIKAPATPPDTPPGQPCSIMSPASPYQQQHGHHSHQHSQQVPHQGQQQVVPTVAPGIPIGSGLEVIQHKGCHTKVEFKLIN